MADFLEPAPLQSALAANDSSRTSETELREALRSYAATLRGLAYATPNGVGERALLQLSERMGRAADQPHAS